MPIRPTAHTLTTGPRSIRTKSSQWKKDNPGTPEPKAADLAVLFFETFSKDNPGKFPSAVSHQGADGKTVTAIEPVKPGFGYPVDLLRHVAPGACRCASAGCPGRHGNGVGLGSRSSYQLAERRVSIGSHFPEMGLRYQARSETGSQRDRADGARRTRRRRSAGSWARKFVNVLQLNLALRNKYGQPQ